MEVWGRKKRVGYYLYFVGQISRYIEKGT